MDTIDLTEGNETPHHQPPSLPASPLPKRIKAETTPAMNEATPTPVATTSLTTEMPPIVPQNIPAIPPLLIKKLSADATSPTRGSADAAGYDLYSATSMTIPARGQSLIDLKIAISVPAGTYGRVAPRSGLASRHGLHTGAGVIDADYRGEVKVLLFNFSDVDYEVKKGDRIAQLILERIITPEVIEVEELETSVRGMGGFGSTGYI